MLNHASQIWVDVTDLANWQGSLTGIQRTHLEIAKNLESLTPIRYFSFSPGEGYVEVSLPTNDQFGSAKLNTNHSTKLTLRRSQRIQSAFKELIAAVLPKQFKRFLSSSKSKIRFGKAQKTLISSSRHPFGIADTIVFLGVTWSVQGHLSNLWEIKQENNLKVASVVYDLIPVLKPHFFGKGFPPHYTNHLVDTIHISDLLISISKSTSRDLLWLINEVHAPAKPIFNIRLGDNPLTAIPEKPSSLPQGWDNFVLSVGTFEIRKNHDLLYKTWEKALNINLEMPPLVIAGRPGWLTHDLEYAITNNPLTKNKIHIIYDCSDENLKWLYENCNFTIYPSWYEGWGLPIAESASEGKLCLSSNSSSMKEIAGDLMDYFDPYSSEQLLSLVQRYSYDNNFLKNKSDSLQKYKPTLWKETAKQIYDILDKFKND